MAITLNNRENFYSDLLHGRYHGLYLAVINNLSHEVFTTRYDLSGAGDEINSQVQAVVTAVLVGNPELFYVGQAVDVQYDGNSVILRFPNNYPDDDHDAQNDEMYKIIDEIVEHANEYELEMDKIMYVNKWLCLNIHPEFDATDDNGNAYGALVKKVARCEGYSEAAKLIFDRLGINCMLCIGKVPYNGSEIAHEWNALEYEGEWYAFDFAWNASTTFHNVVGVIYTFLNQEFISREHHTEYRYPISNDDRYHFWNMHNGTAEYIYELQNADVLECENGFYSVHYLPYIKFDSYQQDYELPGIVKNELSPLSKAETFNFVYLDDIDVLMVYYINL